MKIRQGFVSNSSSSSFVIHKGFLSKAQVSKMFNYQEIVKEYLKDHPIPDKGYYDGEESPEFDFSYYEDSWRLTELDTSIFGDTSMDNFQFGDFLRYIGVDRDLISWDEGWNYEPTIRQKRFLKNEEQRLRKMKINKLDKNV